MLVAGEWNCWREYKANVFFFSPSNYRCWFSCFLGAGFQSYGIADGNLTWEKNEKLSHDGWRIEFREINETCD